MKVDDGYEVVIGLEVHAQLLTKTKLFCGDTTLFGQEPNTQVSIVSLAHPGTLPKMNKEVIRLAVTLGLATHSEIVQRNYFARKNYFYPDLPKGYQISQHTTPICKGGFLEITVGTEKKSIKLNRIHMEEDAGKSIHDDNTPYTQLDFNRAGTPLLEIVTEPDLRSAEEAAAYVTTLRKLVRHLQVCDGNMEEGSLRCDVNISVRKKGDEKLGTKVEIKNLNSIRFIKKAVEYEKEQLIQKLKNGETILQQTKGWDETTSTTYIIRTKEDEDDYRYFPEPDLPPFNITAEEIETVRNAMPPLQSEIKEKLQTTYGLSTYDASLLAEDTELAGLFFGIAKETTNYKAAANWVIGPVKNHLTAQDESTDARTLNPSSIAQLISLTDEGLISYGIASQKIFPHLLSHPQTDIEEYIKSESLGLQSSDETDAHIDAALTKHAQKITEYRKGKKGLLSLFVGEVMKLSKGKANAEEVTKKISEKLNG
ncbi:Asp-tRNA(Asn)/Glu-tRNA(Gln) amidotransferase subunit GatB [Flavisolibacter ginsenosidimutans]|uniref:Aspartyl/glutamyl-tRNA(Asn/Gln) amidotransferase subunit B n=1 Tax=Flavisolibacter ginsenosidimutans TaxID=661481 RepID=A0A5B8UMJ4_9BACT|nr:Asp-tRNA(Asn)/Glu-tRNA(Gln) amidotransferase subunit GatB [Flavisolibacter ginsenosidimutans]QEC57783.1 Asp-tRNA(Asn)/Glu-tRNA(Gln) amidotransferase subunit GatB [Flavisolibacter ginsenosidimutans]